MEQKDERGRISRRDIIKWFAAAAAASQLGPLTALGQESGSLPSGYGTDPKVANFFKPGDHWPLTLTDGQRKIVIALADTILPADDLGPSASSLRVHDFIDEWVSAPYPNQQRSRKQVLPGLKLMNELSQRERGKDFTGLSVAQRNALVEKILSFDGSDALLKDLGSFLNEFTSLCMGAYYGTPQGWKAIGYVGNIPLPTFDGPPQAVLDRVGVTQTVV